MTTHHAVPKSISIDQIENETSKDITVAVGLEKTDFYQLKCIVEQ